MTSSELEKQRALNEKLENDLLQMETHNPKLVATEPSEEDGDALAGLELGKKIVRHLATANVVEVSVLMYDWFVNRLRPQEAVPYHSPRRRIHRYCPS